MTVDVPGDVEVLNCENLVIVEIPSFLKVRGYIMVIFGAQMAAVLHISPLTIEPDGYTLLGTSPLFAHDTLADSKVVIAKLVSSTHVQIDTKQAQFTFMIGWSKGVRLEQIQLSLMAEKLYNGENTLNFNLVSHLFFQDSRQVLAV